MLDEDVGQSVLERAIGGGVWGNGHQGSSIDGAIAPYFPQNGSKLVHPLSVADVFVFKRPKEEDVGEGLLDVGEAEEVDVGEGPFDILQDDSSCFKGGVVGLPWIGIIQAERIVDGKVVNHR